MKRFLVVLCCMLLLVVPVFAAASGSSPAPDQTAEDRPTQPDRWIPSARLDYLGGVFPRLPIIDVPQSQADYSYIYNNSVRFYDSVGVMSTKADVWAFCIPSSQAIYFVSYDAFSILGAYSGTSVFTRVGSWDSTNGIYSIIAYYGDVQSFVPSYDNAGQALNAWKLAYSSYYEPDTSFDMGGFFGLFVLGLPVGMFITALPWVVGYAAGSLKKLLSAG